MIYCVWRCCGWLQPMHPTPHEHNYKAKSQSSPQLARGQGSCSRLACGLLQTHLFSYWFAPTNEFGSVFSRHRESRRRQLYSGRVHAALRGLTTSSSPRTVRPTSWCHKVIELRRPVLHPRAPSPLSSSLDGPHLEPDMWASPWRWEPSAVTSARQGAADSALAQADHILHQARYREQKLIVPTQDGLNVNWRWRSSTT